MDFLVFMGTTCFQNWAKNLSIHLCRVKTQSSITEEEEEEAVITEEATEIVEPCKRGQIFFGVFHIFKGERSF